MQEKSPMQSLVLKDTDAVSLHILINEVLSTELTKIINIIYF